MASIHTRTAALVVAGLVFTAVPSFAQHGGRRDGGDNGRRDGGERAAPRQGGGERTAPRQGGGDRGEARDRGDHGSPRGERVAPRQYAAPRSYNAPRPNVVVPRGVAPRVVQPYRSNGYGYRNYGYRAYGNRPYYYNRSYVVPYGYRPHGYRPGWNLNLYFGRPYAAYGYPADGYGYYAIAPGRSYGAVRIVDAPSDAQVFVDGYYAGVVDDYDGIFQHLNLEVGVHHIEIEFQDAPLTAFDVRVEPGQTLTYHALNR